VSKLNRLSRYTSVLRLFDRKPTGSILEVGCGSQGLAAFCCRQVIGCDVDFSDYTHAARPLHALLLPVQGSAIALPFRDASVDYVVCMDVLEHVPAQLRSSVVAECIRVGRNTILFAFPSGGWAVAADERVFQFLRRSNLQVPLWLQEHRRHGLPSVTDVELTLRQHAGTYTIRNANWHILHYYLERWDRCPRVAPYLAALAELMAPTAWNSRTHRWITNACRLMGRLVFPILALQDLGPPYRTSIMFRHTSGSGVP
jgi:SAM-dependent methyltransferase